MKNNTPFYLFIGNDLSLRLGNSRVSTWTTVTRPTGIMGAFGYNKDTEKLEIYDGLLGMWQEVTIGGTGSSVDTLRYVFMVDG